MLHAGSRTGRTTKWLAVVVLLAAERILAPSAVAGAVPGEEAAEEAAGPPAWLPRVGLEDLECRRPHALPVVDWNDLRAQFRALAQNTLDPGSLKPVFEDSGGTVGRKAMQVRILSKASLVLLRFPEALEQCPLGAITASFFLACLAHLPRTDVSDEPLPRSLEMVLADLGRRSFNELVTRDLNVILEVGELHVTAAAEWNVFAVLNIYVGKLQSPQGVVGDSSTAQSCGNSSVAGYNSGEILQLLQRHVPLASGRNIEGLKFLRGLDPIVTTIMKDPTEFSHQYMHACPAGAAAFAVAASMLALMSNPSLFERFAHLAHYVFKVHSEAVVAGAARWGVFHAVAKMAAFATRPFDLVWSLQELLPLPRDALHFDQLRLNARERQKRLEASSVEHPHAPTRELAAFLAAVASRWAGLEELIVYLTAVGGEPFTDHIAAFVGRAVAVRLPALVIACMDPEAFARCRAVVTEDLAGVVYCARVFEGHVVLVKHAFIPVLLSAAVDTVWIDFDTYILRDPTQAIVDARDRPIRVLPELSRVRYGSFLFHNASDMCMLTKVCDSRQHWAFNISGDRGAAGEVLDDVSDGLSKAGIEVLVTEHWDARCLNNGIFYIRATHRPLVFFTLFLAQLYANPYADNQNLFDSFLAHSTIDSAVPQDRPLLRYTLLDIERRFACAEGHMADSANEIVTFHFWASDSRTREADDAESVDGRTSARSLEQVMQPASGGGCGVEAKGGDDRSSAGGLAANDSPDDGPICTRIRGRDGTERVAKVRATKAELFELFFGHGTGPPWSADVPVAAVEFIERVKSPPPKWKGMCSVTAVGIEDLVDERLLQGNQSVIDWEKAAATGDGVAAGPRGAAARAPPRPRGGNGI